MPKDGTPSPQGSRSRVDPYAGAARARLPAPTNFNALLAPVAAEVGRPVPVPDTVRNPNHAVPPHTAPRGTVSRSGSPRVKRKNVKKTKEQLAALKAAFREHEYLTGDAVQDFATLIGLEPGQVQTWFMTERAKKKHQASLKDGHTSAAAPAPKPYRIPQKAKDMLNAEKRPDGKTEKGDVRKLVAEIKKKIPGIKLKVSTAQNYLIKLSTNQKKEEKRRKNKPQPDQQLTDGTPQVLPVRPASQGLSLSGGTTMAHAPPRGHTDHHTMPGAIANEKVPTTHRGAGRSQFGSAESGKKTMSSSLALSPIFHPVMDSRADAMALNHDWQAPSNSEADALRKILLHELWSNLKLPNRKRVFRSNQAFVDDIARQTQECREANMSVVEEFKNSHPDIAWRQFSLCVIGLHMRLSVEVELDHMRRTDKPRNGGIVSMSPDRFVRDGELFFGWTWQQKELIHAFKMACGQDVDVYVQLHKGSAGSSILPDTVRDLILEYIKQLPPYDDGLDLSLLTALGHGGFYTVDWLEEAYHMHMRSREENAKIGV